MPWNFPFWQVFRFAAPALVAGNVGLLKHASNVPQCALAIEEVFRARRRARGRVPDAAGRRRRASRAIIADPRVAAVTLTGSEARGQRGRPRRRAHLKKTVLELGGSDPFIVLPSADLDAAVATAVKARIINNGQSCIAAKRFIVARRRLRRASRARSSAAMAALKVGDPTRPGHRRSARWRRRRSATARRAGASASVAAGARLLLGGEPLDGPGLLLRADRARRRAARMRRRTREELFGPVAALFRVAGPRRRDRARQRHAVRPRRQRRGRATRAEAERAASRELEAGSVFVNGMVASDPRLPFGGIKRSGYGRELGRLGHARVRERQDGAG